MTAAQQKRVPKRKPVNVGDATHKKVLTIAEFCALHSLSRVTYYQLEHQGRGPKVMFVGAHKRITQEAAAAWRTQMERDAARDQKAK
jgi:hypothetical protein